MPEQHIEEKEDLIFIWVLKYDAYDPDKERNPIPNSGDFYRFFDNLKLHAEIGHNVHLVYYAPDPKDAQEQKKQRRAKLFFDEIKQESADQNIKLYDAETYILKDEKHAQIFERLKKFRNFGDIIDYVKIIFKGRLGLLELKRGLFVDFDCAVPKGIYTKFNQASFSTHCASIGLFSVDMENNYAYVIGENNEFYRNLEQKIRTTKFTERKNQGGTHINQVYALERRAVHAYVSWFGRLLSMVRSIFIVLRNALCMSKNFLKSLADLMIRIKRLFFLNMGKELCQLRDIIGISGGHSWLAGVSSVMKLKTELPLFTNDLKFNHVILEGINECVKNMSVEDLKKRLTNFLTRLEELEDQEKNKGFVAGVCDAAKRYALTNGGNLNYMDKFCRKALELLKIDARADLHEKIFEASKFSEYFFCTSRSTPAINIINIYLKAIKFNRGNSIAAQVCAEVSSTIREPLSEEMQECLKKYSVSSHNNSIFSDHSETQIAEHYSVSLS